MGIEQYLQQILSARYGKDVRQSIHDSIYEINEVAKKAEYDASTAPESAKAYAQAALASEQAAEDYKTAAEQAAEQAMSGTPEGYADLVAKVNSIYRQTATSYNVVGTSEGSALAHTIYGMSVQDGIPTPSVPVDIQSSKADFRCVGKNLIPYPFYSSNGEVSGVTYTINDDDSIKANGTGTAIGFFSFIHRNQGKRKIILSPNNYVLRVEILGGSFIGQNSSYFTIVLREYTSLNGSYKDAVYETVSSVSVGDIISLPFTISENDFTTYPYHNVWFEHHKDNVFNNFTFRYSIELASVTDTTYEPYQHTDVTTDLTLKAIEVTSSDDYNLERDGKYYIADTVDWSEDKGYQITRRVGHTLLPSLTYVKDGSRFVSEVLPVNDNLYSELPTRLTTFLCSSYLNSNTANEGTCFIGKGVGNAKKLYIYTSQYSTLSDFVASLTSADYIVYPLSVYSTEPITSEQAQALLSLKTYDEATSISATGDIEPSVDLEYSKDRNTALALTGHNLAHKNALKLNDINTALIELGGN